MSVEEDEIGTAAAELDGAAVPHDDQVPVGPYEVELRRPYGALEAAEVAAPAPSLPFGTVTVT